MIIVTGASRGLGRLICQRLSDKGFEVLGLARSIEDLPFPAMHCDVSSYESVRTVSRALKNDGQKVTGLVNAAGIASMNLALTTPPEVTQALLNTNLAGTIYSCQLFGALMLRSGKGTIVNFSTIAVSLGLKGESVYAASKAGVEAFTRSFAREMADFNITVNCIAPGPIQTDLLNGVTEEQIDRIVAQQVIPKRFTPASVADVTEILFDDRSSSISGQVLHIGGV